MPELIPHKYGLKFKKPHPDWDVELGAFLIDHKTENGGQGKYRHFINASKIILPEIKFHDWNRIMVDSLCRTDYAHKIGDVIQRFVYWPGCASSGKTWTSAHYAFLWWLADPTMSSVILTSTSGKMLRMRAWQVIETLYFMAKQNFSSKLKVDESKVFCGNLVGSQMVLQSRKGESKFAISGLSVEEGELAKTIAKIQGIHAERVLLVIDEATDTPGAVFKTIKNLEKGCRDLTVLLIGNTVSQSLNAFDRSTQPEKGWHSLSLEDIEWRAKGDENDLCLKSGLSCRFRGKNSPNVKAGKTIYQFLYSFENHQMDKGKEDTIEYWKWVESFPPPAGTANTVMDEVMVTKYDLRGKLKFLSNAIPIAGLDPAFGGDKCVLAIGRMGDMEGGKLGVQITNVIEIPLKAVSDHEIDYQIAQQCIALCRLHDVQPEYCGSDATGIGSGVYSHLRSDWGNCVRVEFGGNPSDKLASDEDPRPSHEVYDRRVTELWYSCRAMAIAGQLKGLTQESIHEFCFRQYEIKSRKTRIETKDEFKKKFGRSPDHADAISVLCEVARQHGLYPSSRSEIGATKDNQMEETEIAFNYEAEEMMNEQLDMAQNIYEPWSNNFP